MVLHPAVEALLIGPALDEIVALHIGWVPIDATVPEERTPALIGHVVEVGDGGARIVTDPRELGKPIHPTAPRCAYRLPNGSVSDTVLPFSTDTVTAMDLLERYDRSNIRRYSRSFCVTLFLDRAEGESEATTLPLAICLAALALPPLRAQ